eukprot:CAMPEP_0182527794 /NCGR_PEP_ID=MMETSP1323-20130603/4084_1 /TAXON_ID=236787 /ORGANISM="Florenciella parvula, Strain RCC1693" /LENGTH=99 /DNA_ID=CAMNT_0024736825 /DNA_START=80 /DNA_END=380 /DNA_ORIENTATION=-
MHAGPLLSKSVVVYGECLQLPTAQEPGHEILKISSDPGAAISSTFITSTASRAMRSVKNFPSFSAKGRLLAVNTPAEGRLRVHVADRWRGELAWFSLIS